MRSLVVGLFIFALSFQLSQCLVCRICSYFPEHFTDLEYKLRKKTSSVINVTSPAKRATLSSITSATYKSNIDIKCLNEPDTSVLSDECDKALNACVLQVVFSLDPEKKEPAILYSCASFSKAGCIMLNDTDSRYEMCACKTDNCSTISQENLRSRIFANAEDIEDTKDTEELPSLDKSIIVIVSAIVHAIFKCL